MTQEKHQKIAREIVSKIRIEDLSDGSLHPLIESDFLERDIAQALASQARQFEEIILVLREGLEWYATPGIHERWRAEEALQKARELKESL